MIASGAKIASDLNPTLKTHERKTVRRQRYQKGSLQQRKHGKRKMWVLLYRDGNAKRYATLGACSEMSKSEAEKKRDEILIEVNTRNSAVPDSDITFGNFVEAVALPFCRSKWKQSTAATTENRIRHHLMGAFSEVLLRDLRLKDLQNFLNEKSAAGLSSSVVSHLRWDLHQIFKVARAEGYIERDPTEALFTPRASTTAERRTMTTEEVAKHIKALEPRERLIDHLAIFVGMRPGEILGLQRRHVNEDGTEITIEQRLYRGLIDTPKTDSSKRTVAIPPRTAALLREWMDCCGTKPGAWLFASENPAKPIWRDNVWYRHMKPKLENVGLEWANFQVMRRTHASLGHDAGIDPKVSADQRGHGIGLALDTYTKSGAKKLAEAAEQLENAVLVA
jgi:integrase